MALVIAAINISDRVLKHAVTLSAADCGGQGRPLSDHLCFPRPDIKLSIPITPLLCRTLELFLVPRRPEPVVSVTDTSDILSCIEAVSSAPTICLVIFLLAGQRKSHTVTSEFLIDILWKGYFALPRSQRNVDASLSPTPVLARTLFQNFQNSFSSCQQLKKISLCKS